ncbi:MAG: type II toxin-antitoxin system prevent-host-death family antitoxin [Anaeromyxobacter sp.]
MRAVGVRELKAHLSSYLRDVARGDVLLVTDRGEVVAELRPPGSGSRELTPGERARMRLIEAGRLKPAEAPGALDWASYPRVRLTRGTSSDLLDADREDR